VRTKERRKFCRKIIYLPLFMSKTQSCKNNGVAELGEKKKGSQQEGSEFA
jgi:hypothetical protein